MTSFGENLTALRKKAKLLGYELAERLGVTPPVVSAWENDRGGLPELPTLFRMANALDCRVEELIDGVDETYSARQRAKAIGESDVEDEHEDVSGHRREDLPVIAEGEASPQGGLFWDTDGKLLSEVEDRITRPYDVRDPRAYGVRVRGDSMLRTFRPGDLVVVSPNITPNDGDEVYVQLLNGERLIKVMRRIPDGYMLESYNPAYEPRIIHTREVGAIHPIVWSKRRASGQRVVANAARTPLSAGEMSPKVIAIARRLEQLDAEQLDTIDSAVTDLSSDDSPSVIKRKRDRS